LQYNGRTHYASWAPQKGGGGIKDTEIGINARAAKEIGKPLLNGRMCIGCQCAVILDSGHLPRTSYTSRTHLPFLAVGLHENDLVKCALIADVLNLRSVHVTPVSSKDWEIIVSDGFACLAAWPAISGQLKNRQVRLYRISIWRGRALGLYLYCHCLAGIAIDPLN